METTTKRSGLYGLTATAVLTAVTCALGPLSIPIGPIPVSLTNLVLYLSVYLLGWKRAAVSCAVYLLIGAAGLPVFSGFRGGLGVLLGLTGGYLAGFLPLTVLSGLAVELSRRRWLHLGGMVLGTAVCYAFGTAWFCLAGESTVAAALAACVFPFIPVDLVKMAAATAIGPQIRDRLIRAGLYQGR